MVPALKNLSYPERLRKLKLPSLSYRRLRGDMITTFKITNGLLDLEPGIFFSLPPHQNTRGHSKKLAKEKARTEKRRATFAPRIVNCWNSLPEPIVTAPSVRAFEARLDKHWIDQDIVYSWDATESEPAHARVF